VEEPKLQCACANCGEVIAYARADIGSAVECPKCHEKSQLPEPTPVFSNPIEPGAFEPEEELEAARKRVRFCGVCRAPIPEGQLDCGVCKLLRRARKRRIAILIFTLTTMTAVAVFDYKHQKRADNPGQLPDPKGPLPRPNVNAPISTNELNVISLTLRESRQLNEATVLLAVGDVKNDSDRSHFDLKLDLDLLDASGTKIDSLPVYMNNLVPHGNWHFAEMVTNTQVKRIRFAGLTEQK
jgi:predicted nucleic acid-binding Zn ribbon protein